MKSYIRYTLMVLCVLAMTVGLVACSGAKLTMPENLTYDGATIRWDAVEGAASYEVQIDNGEVWTVSQPMYSYNAKGANFTVTVTPVNEKGKTGKDTTATMQFKPLGELTNVVIADDGSLTWDAVEYATGYEVRLNGKETATVTETAYPSPAAGKQKIEIRPVIVGDPSYYASWNKVAEYTVLGTVAKDDITYNEGRVQWKVVSGAQYYEVSINGLVVDAACNATSYEYESNEIDFEVTVKAIGNHVTSYDGATSDIKNFVYLDTVTAIRVEDGVLYWDAVNNADGYRLKINGVITDVVRELSYSALVANRNNEIQIIPVTDDSTYFSSWSAKTNVFILSAPAIRWVNDLELDDGTARNSVVWDQVPGAGGYLVRLKTPDDESIHEVTQPSFGYDYATVGDYTIEVRAIPAANDATTYGSAYSTPISVTRLAAPTLAEKNAIVSDAKHLSRGFTVTFNRLPNASGYTLYKDGNAIHERNTATQFAVGDLVTESLVEQTYNFSIRALGSIKTVNGRTTVILNSLQTADFVITVLAVPAAPSIEGYIYSFGESIGANGYVVDVGSQAYTTVDTSYDLSTLAAGEYIVSACAEGDGGSTLPSNYTTAIKVHRLQAPTNICFETTTASEGVLTYDTVANASGYEVKFGDDGEVYPANSAENINNKITEKGTAVYMRCTANAYNDDKTVYYMTSPWSETKVFIKLSAPTFGDVCFDGNNLVWKPSENINSAVYTPTYQVFNGQGVASNGEMNGTSMDISFLEGGESYTFYIKAIGDGSNYINSDASAEVSIYKLETPKVSASDGAYHWNAVTSANSYVVYVDGVKQASFDHQTGASYAYTPDFKDLKTYHVEIVAIGDGGYQTINSKPCIIEQKTQQLITPDFSISYTEPFVSSTGQIKLTITTPTPNNRGYVYTVGGVSTTSTEETFLYSTNSVGSFKCSVYAVGGNFDENGIYYISSQSQGNNDRYKIDLLASPNPSDWLLNQDGQLTWTPVQFATSYEIELSINNGATTKTVQVNKVSFRIDDFTNIHQVTVCIRALGDGTHTVTSKWAERTWSNLH